MITFFWLLRYGQIEWDLIWNDWGWRAGNTWYDGPILYLGLGPFWWSCSAPYEWQEIDRLRDGIVYICAAFIVGTTWWSLSYV